MRVSFNTFNFSSYTNKETQSVNFESAKGRKLVEKVRNTKILDKLHISFDELELMYKELGYDVFYKRGSHAIVHLTENTNLPLVIPHKNKNVHPKDLKRFKYVLAGEINKALNC